MSIWMGVPFLGVLLSLAFFPLIAPNFWKKYESLVGLFWICISIFSMGKGCFHDIKHTLVYDYIPFICLIFSLFTINAGILIDIQIKPIPFYNLIFLAIASLCSNFLGTTGASILFFRSFLKLNRNRTHKIHHVIFFIFLVCNIGGCLTPLGDPPLFMGFLKGVEFFWPTAFLYRPFLCVWGLTLLVYFLIDTKLSHKDQISSTHFSFGIYGKRNILLLFGVMAITLLTPMISNQIIQNIIRNSLFVGLGLLSLVWTPRQIHEQQNFTFEPFLEVARVFFVIFITMIPVLSMIKLGSKGPAAVVFENLVHANHLERAYFWLSGLFSAFLDNAPTYLIFFQIAGGNPHELMYANQGVLQALSLGTVFMGAMSYIGNSPNLIIYSLAVKNGIKMPSFLGYMLWSFGILLPIFFIMTLAFFK